GGDDVLVAGAAAEVTGDGLANLWLGGIRAVLQELRQRHEETRRAEPALQAVVLPEGLLQRIEPVAVGQRLHGPDLTTVHLCRKEQAGPDSGAIDDPRAGAAHAVLAAEVRARELEIVTQEVGQRLANLDHPLVRAAVDDDADLPLFHLGLARE